MPSNTKPMKRTPFSRGLTGALSSRSFQISKKPVKRMKAGKVRPAPAESLWMGKVAGFGCIVCHMQGREGVPCAVHHIIEGGRRVSHMFTIGLCDPGHHQNAPQYSSQVSRHPDKARFEKAYGTEYQLLSILIEKLQPSLPSSFLHPHITGIK